MIKIKQFSIKHWGIVEFKIYRNNNKMISK